MVVKTGIIKFSTTYGWKNRGLYNFVDVKTFFGLNTRIPEMVRHQVANELLNCPVAQLAERTAVNRVTVVRPHPGQP